MYPTEHTHSTNPFTHQDADQFPDAKRADVDSLAKQLFKEVTGQSPVKPRANPPSASSRLEDPFQNKVFVPLRRGSLPGLARRLDSIQPPTTDFAAPRAPAGSQYQPRSFPSRPPSAPERFLHQGSSSFGSRPPSTTTFGAPRAPADFLYDGSLFGLVPSASGDLRYHEWPASSSRAPSAPADFHYQPPSFPSRPPSAPEHFLHPASSSLGSRPPSTTTFRAPRAPADFLYDGSLFGLAPSASGDLPYHRWSASSSRAPSAPAGFQYQQPSFSSRPPSAPEGFLHQGSSSLGSRPPSTTTFGAPPAPADFLYDGSLFGLAPSASGDLPYHGWSASSSRAPSAPADFQYQQPSFSSRPPSATEGFLHQGSSSLGSRPPSTTTFGAPPAPADSLYDAWLFDLTTSRSLEPPYQGSSASSSRAPSPQAFINHSASAHQLSYQERLSASRPSSAAPNFEDYPYLRDFAEPPQPRGFQNRTFGKTYPASSHPSWNQAPGIDLSDRSLPLTYFGDTDQRPPNGDEARGGGSKQKGKARRSRDQRGDRARPYQRHAQSSEPTSSHLDEEIPSLPAATANLSERDSRLFKLDNQDWKTLPTGVVRCKRCPNTFIFATPADIAVHDEKIHGQIAPVICGLNKCQERFSTVRERSKHVIHIHKIEEQDCPCCGDELSFSGCQTFHEALERHLWTKHLEVNWWQCTFCDERREFPKPLLGHINYTHCTIDRMSSKMIRDDFIDENTGLPINAHYVNIGEKNTIIAYHKDKQPATPNPVDWSRLNPTS